MLVKLRAANFEITAVHNHVLDETRRSSTCTTWDTARPRTSRHPSALPSLRPRRRSASPRQVQPTDPAPFVKTVEDALGVKGTWNGGVLGFGIPRAEPITEDGMALTAAQGAAEAINLQEAGPGKVATTGDFVLIAAEVNPVISALEAHNIEVTALHSHMLTEQPRLFFMHFWAVGSPESMSQGIKAALDQIHMK